MNVADEINAKLMDLYRLVVRGSLDVDKSAPKDSIRVNQAGDVGLGMLNPQARFHVPAGSSNKPPLMIDVGTVNAETEPHKSGAVESDGIGFYWTDTQGHRHDLTRYSPPTPPYVLPIPLILEKNQDDPLLETRQGAIDSNGFLKERRMTMMQTSWLADTAYVIGNYLTDAGKIYNCILGHTSSVLDEPGVGANWATYWADTGKTALPIDFFLSCLGTDPNAKLAAKGGSLCFDPVNNNLWQNTDGDKAWLDVTAGTDISGKMDKALGAVEGNIAVFSLLVDGDVEDSGVGILDLQKRIIEMKVFSDTQLVASGDGKLVLCIPAALDGMNLIDPNAFCSTASTAGLPTVQVRNVTTGYDMLSTLITINVGAYTSYTATTPPVVNPLYKIVHTGNLLAIDVDVTGSGTKGLGIILNFS